MKKITHAVLLLSFFSAVCASETRLAWQQPLDEENSWSRLTFAGTLLVASENQLAHYDPSSGQQMWRRDDLQKLAQFDVRDVRGTPYLVINEHVGNRSKNSRLQVLNVASGESLWDSGEIKGFALGSYPVPGKGLLVSAINLRSDGDLKSGLYLVAYSLKDGGEKWRTRLGKSGSLPVHRSDTSSAKDFSGHPQPIVTGDTFILVAGDLIAVDITTGAQKWRFKLKASNSKLKQTYAQPLLVDGVLYAVSRNSLHALDIATGAEKWKAKIGTGAMPQLELADNLIVGRIGGTFSDSKNLVEKKPFGAFAVDTSSGKLAWKWTKANDSLTNLRLLPDAALVMVADKKRLYALDLNAVKKGKVVYYEDLEFKRKLGSADIAAKGLGVVGGLLGGGIAGGIAGLGGGADRGDPPLDIEIYGDKLIIRAQYHVLAHNMTERATDWSIEFEPPGMSPFALIAMGAVTAYVVADRAGSAGAYGSGLNSQQLMDTTLAISNSFQEAVAARYATAEKARNLAFFLTKEEDGMVLMGIDLAGGTEIGKIPMAEKEPKFMIDAIGSRVYYFKDKTELLAYDF